MKLEQVQLQALARSGGRPGYAYFMEMGLGKTLTILAEFAELVAKGEATRLVVVCPNSFKGGWVDEINKWGFDFNVMVYQSGGTNYWAKVDKPPVLIINYEAIRMGGSSKNPIPSPGMLYVAAFARDKDCMVVADESIQIKTHDSAQTRGALWLAKQFKYRRILSGKPITQGPHDLWAQMRFIGNLDGQNYFAFKTAFCKMGGFKMKQVVGAQNEDILAERIEPWVFRATKADWTDLPPKSYTIREYSLSPEMKAKYRSMEEDFVLWLESGEVVTVDAAITKYIKLAQIQAGFIYTEDGSIEWLVPDERNPRLNALKEVIENEVVGKYIVVYNHKPVKKQLAVALSAHNPVFIHGEMQPEEIREAKRRFNDDPDCKAICITKAAKYGHTLLGDQTTADLACATELWYENTYSLDDRSQLEDRDHRHGQKQLSVLNVDFAGTPLDKNAIRALQRKEGVFQAVFKNIRAMRQ